MAFLDNSGDIVLDAVLTDAGRQRLARGDGSFKITQFALGDDEINYTLYDKTNASGSAYYDLNILQTPVFEAFTNNIASLNSKLLTIPRNNLFYLPVILLKTTITESVDTFTNAVVVAVNSATEDALSGFVDLPNYIQGFSFSSKKPIELDQGINNENAGTVQRVPADLLETQYSVEIDNRLGRIIDAASKTDTINEARKSFVDDDNIAYYQFSLSSDRNFVSQIDLSDNNTPIVGLRGTRLTFSLLSSIELQTSNYLFQTLGTYSGDYYSLNSNITITGLTTGYSVTIPVKFVKYSPQ